MILGYAWVPINGEIPASMEFPAAHLFADKASAQTPPAFVFAGDKDEEVSYTQSERVAQILQKAGVPVELRIFHGAPHGFGLRGKGEEKAWPELCAAWLERQGVIPSTIK
jgi:acetyl esterase/lipase